nr:lipoate--protein ligase [uncultured Oscillibacter sp.]
MAVTYLETRSQNPYYNLAFEELVLERRRDGEYLLLWQNDNTIVVGQNQNTEAEINREFVEAHGINVVRRSTGGGAVYHDLGNLNYSFITDVGDAERLTMERFTRPIVEALQGLGLQAEASGRNDILVEGRKVSGTAQRVVRGRILHHGTLLFSADPGMVAGALNVDPAKFQSKGTQSVRSRIGNIRDFLSADMEIGAFWEYLKKTLAGNGMVTGSLAAEELAAVEALKCAKYDTWEWNYGRSPRYDMTNKRRFEGGGLEVRTAVKEGRITGIVFYGDFLAVAPLDGLTAALEGCAFRREAVAEVLDTFPIGELFGTITKDEILETIFYVS